MLQGNALVGQSGGPTAAINATLAGVIRGVLEQAGQGPIETLYGMRNGVEGLFRGDYLNLTDCMDDDAKLEQLIHTPAAALGSCRKKLPDSPDDPAYDTVFAEFLRLNIRYFFYIGGNDSMDSVVKLTAAAKCRDYDLRVIGVPKTIDNDLVETDHTPGFGSAAKYVAVSIEEIIRDCSVYTVPAVTIVEIMGRDSGWLTAASALPGAVFGEGPDLIYLPERAFVIDQFLSDVRAALAKHPNVVVAVSEGIKDENGEYLGGGKTPGGAQDVFAHRYLAGTAKYLETVVKQEIGCKVRAVELNLPQRCAAHIASETDLEESVFIGASAVRAAVDGVSGCMMTFIRTEGDAYGVVAGTVPAERVANQIKVVPDSMITPDGTGITDEGIAYLLPLIQGESMPAFVSGLPLQFKF